MITSRTEQGIKELIDGPAGKLEIVMEEAKTPTQRGWAVVCHPHPLYGGTMTNKVVTTIAKTFQHLGMSTIRFNFRGVGQSEGAYGHGEGEVEDLLAVIDYVNQMDAGQPLWLGGFSFGSYVAAKTATMVPTDKLVTVAPAVEHFPMQDIPPIECDWVVVQGDRDDVVPPDAVYAWVETREPKPTVIRFPEAGHFFHGLLMDLREQLTRALTHSQS